VIRDSLEAAQLNHTVARDTSYSPYGEDYGGSGTGIVQNFAGMLSDNDSNVLFDTPNREFDVSSGSRWLSPDPARASWNAYAYPTNPNSFIDPSGLVRLPTDPGDRISGSWFLGLSGFGNLGGGCTIDGVDASCAQATQTVAGGLGTIDRSNPFTQGSAVGIAQSNLSSGLLTPSTVMPGVTGTVTPCEEGDFCSNVTANEAPVGPEAGSDLMLLAQGPGQLPPSASGAVQAARQMAQNAAQNGRYGPKTTPPTPPRSIVDPRQTPDMNPQEPWWIRLWGMWDVTGTLTELPFVIMPSVQACGYSGSCPDQPAKGPI
jgi:RHS repeat-associated protein